MLYDASIMKNMSKKNNIENNTRSWIGDFDMARFTDVAPIHFTDRKVLRRVLSI